MKTQFKTTLYMSLLFSGTLMCMDLSRSDEDNGLNWKDFENLAITLVDDTDSTIPTNPSVSQPESLAQAHYQVVAPISTARTPSPSSTPTDSPRTGGLRTSNSGNIPNTFLKGSSDSITSSPTQSQMTLDVSQITQNSDGSLIQLSPNTTMPSRPQIRHNIFGEPKHPRSAPASAHSSPRKGSPRICLSQARNNSLNAIDPNSPTSSSDSLVETLATDAVIWKTQLPTVYSSPEQNNLIAELVKRIKATNSEDEIMLACTTIPDNLEAALIESKNQKAVVVPSDYTDQSQLTKLMRDGVRVFQTQQSFTGIFGAFGYSAITLSGQVLEVSNNYARMDEIWSQLLNCVDTGKELTLPQSTSSALQQKP